MGTASPRPVDAAAGIGAAAATDVTGLLHEFGVAGRRGLSVAEVAERRARWGPNAVSSHQARLLPVLWHQVRSPLLALLLTAALASSFVGERGDAVIIGVIVALSVGLGFVIDFARAVPAAGAGEPDAVLRWGLLATENQVGAGPAVGGNPLDQALWRAPATAGQLATLAASTRVGAVALTRLSTLGIAVKVVTGDNAAVAQKVCAELGLAAGGALTGVELSALDDDALAAAIAATTVFARVSPEDKARIVRVRRRGGGGVAFLGDGVNDALALHAADVGISVDSATDVAKDAADVILLEKDLDVLADGVAEGRRIFANTIKYVLMGTSSNFGNMFSAAGASLFLSFLPMLPSQILLNNLLYDSSQLAIPTDHVDEAQLRQPSQWDIGFIRRFMIFFGPLSSVFDFATFAIMLWVFHAGTTEFRSGWFVESLATQTLVIFAIRTHQVPFFRSRPSLPLVLAAAGVVIVGSVLPASPLAPTLGLSPLPAGFFAALAALALGYLALIEAGKRVFYRAGAITPPGRRPYSRTRALRRRAARFSVHNLIAKGFPSTGHHG